MPIELNRTSVRSFCERHHIRKLSLFGSAIRADFGPESDIDVLVEFEAGQEPGLFAIVRMQQELSQIVAGRRIDLRTPNELSRYFRDHVMATARVQYGE